MAKIPAAYRLNELEIRLMKQFDLALGTHARAAAESPGEFLERIARQAPEVIVKAEGSIEIAALVFSITPEVLDDMKGRYPQISDAHTKGLGIHHARKTQADEVVVEVKKELLRSLTEEDSRPVRKNNLPSDPAKRLASLLRLIPDYLEPYYGCPHQMSGPMKATSDEIQQAIDSDEDLLRQQTIFRSIPKAAALKNLQNRAATDTSAAAAKYLEKVFPEEFGPKQDINLKNFGFEPPPADHGTQNVLTRRNKENEE